MNAKIEITPIEPLKLDTVEDVADAIDAWILAGHGREVHLSRNILGHTAKLLERGMVVVIGRGRGTTNAQAHALELLDFEVTR